MITAKQAREKVASEYALLQDARSRMLISLESLIKNECSKGFTCLIVDIERYYVKLVVPNGKRTDFLDLILSELRINGFTVHTNGPLGNETITINW